jgi:hypothetical protein
MGWSLGYDGDWERDIGYGVPAYCDHPDCNERIDRGLSYVCGGEHGCGLYFCWMHLHEADHGQQCERCINEQEPFDAKPDHPLWTEFKMTDPSWERWRRKRTEPTLPDEG